MLVCVPVLRHCFVSVRSIHSALPLKGASQLSEIHCCGRLRRFEDMGWGKVHLETESDSIGCLKLY